MAAFLLLPSPLLGPSCWAWSRAALEARGHVAVVATPRPPLEAPQPWWSSWVSDAVADAPIALGDEGELVIVGHSGAGYRLPALAGALEAAAHRVVASIFVDANIPLDGRSPLHGASADLVALADAMTDDQGIMRPWVEWWGEEAMAELVPDSAMRSAIERDCPRVPRALLDEPVPVSPSWPAHPVGLLSYTYDEAVPAALARGLAVGQAEGNHLQMVVAPEDVADQILLLLGAMGVSP